MFSFLKKIKIKKYLLPIFTGLFLFCITTCFWLLLNARENMLIQRHVETKSDEQLSLLITDLQNRLPLLIRIANRWKQHKEYSKKDFENEAYSCLNDLPGFFALVWIDKDYYLRWIVPEEGNENLLNRNHAEDEKIKTDFEKAKVCESPIMTSLIDLNPNNNEFLILFPVFSVNEFDGSIAAAFKINEWLDIVFSGRNAAANLNAVTTVVYIDDNKVFTKMKDVKIKYTKFTFSSETKFLGHKFKIECTPMSTDYTIVPELIAVTGFLASILIALIVYLLQKTTSEITQNKKSKESLQLEINERKITEQKLLNITARLNLAVNSGRIGIWTWDIKSNQFTWNKLMYEFYNIPEDITPNYDMWKKTLHPEDLNLTEKKLFNALKGKEVFDSEFKIKLNNGSIKHIKAAASVERDKDNTPISMTGINIDITAQKQFQELLMNERRRLSYILEGTNVGTWEWNIQTGKTVFNERWAEIIGYSLHELSPVSIDTWIKFGHPEDLRKSNEILEKHFRKETDHYECEVRMKHKNGKWIWVLDKGKVFKWTDDGKPLLMSGTHQDITERKEAEEKIEYLANHDALTGLPALRLVKDRMQQSILHAKRNKNKTAVLFLDLDGFKSVNDNYGHETGDLLLKEIAQRLQNSIRESDTVARIGGDEFLIILNDIHEEEDTIKIAKKIIKLSNLPFQIGQNTFNISFSIGISIYPDDGYDFDSLVKKSDSAMYSVKFSGKNNFSFAE